MPFYSKDDERLRWLEEVFLKWLSEWRKSVPNKNNFLSDETYEAIVLTCKSTASCIRHLLDQGFNYVLTRKFSTDDIERAHGAIRHHCGSNDHPHVAAALSAVDKMIRTGLAKTSIACNVPLVKEKSADTGLPLISTQAQNEQVNKRRAQFELSRVSLENLKILDELKRAPGRKISPIYNRREKYLNSLNFTVPPPKNLESSVVSFNAGYVIKTLEEQEDFCKECIELYSQPASSSNHCRFIRLQGKQ